MDRWEQSLTPEQRVRLEAARLQALGLALSGGPPIFSGRHSALPLLPTNTARPCMAAQMGQALLLDCD
jgi:hypothetical protein